MRNTKTYEEWNWPEKWKFGKNKGRTQQHVPPGEYRAYAKEPDPKPELSPEKIKQNEINQRLKPYYLYAVYSNFRNNNGERIIEIYIGDGEYTHYDPIESDEEYNDVFARISDFDDVDYAIVSYNKNDEKRTLVRKKVANIDAGIDYIIQLKENEKAESRRKSREYTQESVKVKTVQELNEGSGDMAACSCNSKKKKNKGMKKMLKKMKWENL